MLHPGGIASYLEGVCLTTVILAPGVGNPGSVPHRMLRFRCDPRDPVDPLDPLQNSPWAPMTVKKQYTGTFFPENEAHIALKGPAAPRRPKNPQDGPKIAPRPPHDRPKTPQVGPKIAPRRPKTAPRRPKTAKRRPKTAARRLYIHKLPIHRPHGGR